MYQNETQTCGNDSIAHVAPPNKHPAKLRPASETKSSTSGSMEDRNSLRRY